MGLPVKPDYRMYDFAGGTAMPGFGSAANRPKIRPRNVRTRRVHA